MKNVVAPRIVAGMTSSVLRLAGFGMTFLAITSLANATPAPEIDPGSMSSGLALLAGAMLWVSGRRPRK